MDEAERLCDRVAVVDRGQVIALGTPAELIRKIGGEHVVEFSLGGGASLPEAELRRLPGVEGVQGATLRAAEPHVVLPALLELARSRGATLAGLTTRSGTLEDVFVTLTGRQLRDGD